MPLHKLRQSRWRRFALGKQDVMPHQVGTTPVPHSLYQYSASSPIQGLRWLTKTWLSWKLGTWKTGERYKEVTWILLVPKIGDMEPLAMQITSLLESVVQDEKMDDVPIMWWGTWINNPGGTKSRRGSTERKIRNTYNGHKSCGGRHRLLPLLHLPYLLMELIYLG